MLGGSSKVQWDTLPFQPPKPTDDIFVEGGDEAQDPGVLKGFSGKKIHEIPSCFSEFCKLTSCELQKNMEEELPETDPENVNPVAWLKQFDIKEIVTSEPSRDSLDGNRCLPSVMEIMYPGHSTWTTNTFSHPLFGSNDEMLHVRKHLEGVLAHSHAVSHHGAQTSDKLTT